MKRLPLMFAIIAAGLVSARAQIQIRGDADYEIHHDRVRLACDYIGNYTETNTGLLRFRLWATENRWGSSGGDKHTLALSIIPALKPGMVRPDIHRTVHFSSPDPGWWYVTLTLEQRIFDYNGKRRWEIRDVYQFGEEFLADNL